MIGLGDHGLGQWVVIATILGGFGHLWLQRLKHLRFMKDLREWRQRDEAHHERVMATLKGMSGQ